MMGDYGQIITHLEQIFGDTIDHEVIKMVLQACSWDPVIAHESLSKFVENSNPSNEHGGEECLATNSGTFANITSKRIPSPGANGNTNKPRSIPSPVLNNNVTTSAELNLRNVSKETEIKQLIAKKRKIMVIMRGLPGSGKSTMAHSLKENGVVLSTDDYFYDKYGHYNYNPSILSEAHNWNKDRAKLKVYNDISPIFIDNTNLQLWEFEPYIKIALDYDYYVTLLEPQTSWKYNCKELSEKGIHDIPFKRIKEMKSRFERNISVSDVIKRFNSNSTNNRNFQDAANTVALIETGESAEKISDSDDADIVIENSESSDDATTDCVKVNLPSNKMGENEGNSSVMHNTVVDMFEDLTFNERHFVEDSKITETLVEYIDPIEEQTSQDKGNSTEVLPLSTTDDDEKTGSSCNTDKEFNCEAKHIDEWNSVDSPELDTLTNWDSDPNCKQQVNKTSLDSDSKPPRNTVRKQEPSNWSENIWDEKNGDDLISWDTVESCQDSWNNIAKACGGINSVNPASNTGAVPKQTKAKVELQNKERNSPSLNALSMSTNATQYQSSDYLHSDKNSRTLNCNPSSFIPGIPVEVKDNEPLTKNKLVLHKSSMTDDSEQTQVGSTCILGRMKAFFPTIPSTDLEDVLEKCDYDLDWAMNLLIDGGYEISDTVDNVSRSNSESDTVKEVNDGLRQTAQLNLLNTSESVVDYPSDDDEVNEILKELNATEMIDKKKDIEGSFMSAQTVDDRVRRLTQKDFIALNMKQGKKRRKKNTSVVSSNAENQSAQENNGVHSKKERCPFIMMDLSPSFATQLIDQFGPISSLKVTSGFTVEDRNIILPLEICKKIYDCWTKTLDSNFQHETDILNQFIREDEDFARKLQEEENALVVASSDGFNIDSPTNMQEIIELEKALHISNLNVNKFSKEDKYISSMLSLQKLKEEFSHVDSIAVETEYNNNGCDFNATKSLLFYKYGNKSSIPESDPSEFATNLPKSQEEIDTDVLSEMEIIVDDPQVYRDEAQMHYLERKKALQKAQDASQQGMKSVASYYAQIANSHFLKCKEANERASKKILNALNANRGPNTLDLHLLHVTEALREAQIFLSQKRRFQQQNPRDSLEVTIITGKGNHSLGGEPKLKPAVRYFLKKEGYSFHECSGMFKVTLGSFVKS